MSERMDESAKGGVEDVAALHRRITELERALAEAQGASAFLESVLEAAPVFISKIDPQLRIRFLNRYQAGHTPEETIGVDVRTFIGPADREHATVCMEQALTTGETTTFTLHQAAGAHGAPTSYVSRVCPVREPDGSLSLCVASLDVTAEERRTQELRESKEMLAFAVNATGLGLWSWDLTTDRNVWDPGMLALHGCSSPPSPAAYVDQVVHPEDREALLGELGALLAAGTFDHLTYRIFLPDGRVRWLLTVGRTFRDDAGRIVKLMGGSLDVTRQRELEEQLRKSQRLEAVGSLTAGVAHNFNNMLAVISPTLEIAMLSATPELRRMLQDAAHAARRAAELVRQLMTYAGHGTSDQRATCEVARLVHAAVGICRRTFDAKIALGIEQLGPPSAVVCSPGQIEQLLVNLLLNARDAVQATESHEGTVTVRIRLAEPGTEHADVHQTMVCIDVVDDGIGMSETVRARLFEPFFTTKGVGKGTGLGLATSYAIARDHRGRLSCRSTLGKGTQFTLALPLAREHVEEVPYEPEPILSQRAQVLLVDDDEVVRRTLQYVLTQAGHSVFEAKNGAAALEQLARNPDIQLVLLDRSMPGGDGERYVDRMRSLAPDARIVFLSGRTIEPELRAQVDAIVQKPVTRTALLGIIERVLS